MSTSLNLGMDTDAKLEIESEEPPRPLSPYARYVINAFQKKEAEEAEERKITVNPIVTKFASWYEKLRNAMEFREDEVVLRATIERILKRRLLLGGNGKTTAEALIKELLWARYLPNEEIAESVTGIKDVENHLKVNRTGNVTGNTASGENGNNESSGKKNTWL